MVAKILNISEAEYRTLDAVNWSQLKKIETSPKHYLASLSEEFSDTTFMRKGRAAHCLALEPDVFERDFAVFEGTRRGPKWDQFKLDHQGKDIINTKEYDDSRRIADAVRGYAPARELIDAATLREQPITWTDEETGIQCKGKPDLATDLWLPDMKTSNDLDFKAFMKVLGFNRYFAQLSFYRDGLEAVDGIKRRVCIIGAESVTPYDVGVFEIDEHYLSIGQRHYRMLLEILKNCHATNEWPGRYPAAQGFKLAEIPDFSLDSPLDELDYEGIEVVA